MQVREFGKTKEGQTAFLYTMENGKGMKAAVTDYGANLVSLLVPDKDNEVEDVVLGFDCVQGYEENPDFFGALIAPSANRIQGACFCLGEENYILKKNNGQNNLHSDEERGSHKRIWAAEVEEETVTLRLFMEDMDMGFPGNRKIEVRYTLTEENELKIEYKIISDRKTVINPTNHTYFNLKGHGQGDILDHRIILSASNYTPTDQESIPTGDIAAVEKTPMDLRQEVVVGERIEDDFEQLCFARGYDHNWVTDNYDGRIRYIGVVKAPDDQRVMEVYTDLPGVQFYTGNFISEQTGKSGIIYKRRSGLCLETQYYPDSVHKRDFPSVIFGPDREYRSATIYKFVTV